MASESCRVRPSWSRSRARSSSSRPSSWRCTSSWRPSTPSTNSSASSSTWTTSGEWVGRQTSYIFCDLYYFEEIFYTTPCPSVWQHLLQKPLQTSNIKLSLEFLDDFRSSRPCRNLGSRKLMHLFVTVTSLYQNPVQRVSLPKWREHVWFMVMTSINITFVVFVQFWEATCSEGFVKCFLRVSCSPGCWAAV